MILGIGIAVAVLYSGSADDGKDSKIKVADSDRCLAFSAVPSDAVLIASFEEYDICQSVKEVPTVVSLHYYSGRLQRLHVVDVKKCPENAAQVIDDAQSRGNYSAVEGNLILVSDSETLLKSAQRHLAKGISILDASGFADAVDAVEGSDVLYISNIHFGKLLPAVVNRPYTSYSAFLERLADWSVFDISKTSQKTSLTGTLIHDQGPSDFITILGQSRPSVSKISEVLPSYTLFAATLPLKDMDSYISGYKSYLDTRQKLQVYQAAQKRVAAGVGPVELLRRWEVVEVAIASFVTGSTLETVNLMKVDSPELSTIFQGTEVSDLKGYTPSVHAWSYPSLLSSVFGNFFDRKDESCFTYIDGWVVTGSQAAVEEYASGRALEYNLKQYMSDCGQDDLLAEEPVSFSAYFSFTEDKARLSEIFRKGFMNVSEDLWNGADYAPAVLTVSGGRKDAAVTLDVHRLELKKTKAPTFERDTVVVVPKGPFKVKNSGTGKMNSFYQNSHNSLCLSQDGKDLWGVPFDKPLCGRAGTVDYYANGKLQILFCAGDKMYLIDRLGRYVTGFPLSLKKDVLLGPDIYDFNGARKYNVMVLHKDNTVEMYNLKGQKPGSWKGITSSETIKNLPERIEVGGSSFWVVRTSIQTLIYPFYGGEPLTVFSGDKMIKPDSSINVVDGTTVDFTCYDGKVRTEKLK